MLKKFQKIMLLALFVYYVLCQYYVCTLCYVFCKPKKIEFLKYFCVFRLQLTTLLSTICTSTLRHSSMYEIDSLGDIKA